jgi:hypothetical protein
MTKEKPVMKVESAGLSPMFPVILDAGTVEMPLLASTTKPAAESRLTGECGAALADKLVDLKSRGVPNTGTNEEVLAMTIDKMDNKLLENCIMSEEL